MKLNIITIIFYYFFFLSKTISMSCFSTDLLSGSISQPVLANWSGGEALLLFFFSYFITRRCLIAYD